jgi:hypothetical protein
MFGDGPFALGLLQWYKCIQCGQNPAAPVWWMVGCVPNGSLGVLYYKLPSVLLGYSVSYVDCIWFIGGV